MKRAFTLAELLIALGVVGVLAAILMPVIQHITPNQDTVMAKRVFFTVQNVVSELINDPACYPDKTASTGSDRAFGFEDGYGYEGCTYWDSNIDTEGNANDKFLTLFMNKVDGEGTNDSFTTKDGVVWTAVTKSFSKTGTKPSDRYLKLKADVNGSEADGDFTMQIDSDGKITILDDWAKEAVKVTKSLSD